VDSSWPDNAVLVVVVACLDMDMAVADMADSVHAAPVEEEEEDTDSVHEVDDDDPE
jgi:hypothetical protein